MKRQGELLRMQGLSTFLELEVDLSSSSVSSHILFCGFYGNSCIITS